MADSDPLSVPLFGGVSISTSEPFLGDDDQDDVLGKPSVDDDDGEDIFGYKNTKKIDEDDLFDGLDDPLVGTTSVKKPAVKASSGLFDDDQAAEDMLSHDFNDLLVLKASHKEEPVFNARPKAVELAAADEDDVRVPDIDLENLQRRDSTPTVQPKGRAPSLGGSGSAIKRSTAKTAAPTTLDDELFGLLGNSSTSSGGSTDTTSAALDDISSYIAKQQQTTSKGLFDD